MNMTLNDLIEYLEDIRDQYDAAEHQVRIAYQPTYPLRAAPSVVQHDRDVQRASLEDEDPGEDPDMTLDEAVEEASSDIVWIATGGSLPYDENPYAPREAFNER